MKVVIVYQGKLHDEERDIKGPYYTKDTHIASRHGRTKTSPGRPRAK